MRSMRAAGVTRGGSGPRRGRDGSRANAPKPPCPISRSAVVHRRMATICVHCNDTGSGVRQSSVAGVARVSSNARRDLGKDRLPGAMLKAQQVIR